MVKVTFIQADGSALKVEAPVGLSLLEVAHQNGLDEIEGACEGSLACSTCHVVVDPSWYEALPEPTDDENDMLDLAFGLKPTSRLGCQIMIKPELDGLVVHVPSATRNITVK